MSARWLASNVEASHLGLRARRYARMDHGSDRRRLRFALIVICGVVVGALTALLRVIDGDYHGLSTGGLVFIGAFFTVGGFVYAIPRVWQRQIGHTTWTGKTVFGEMRPREELPAWRRLLWDLQGWLIERDRRQVEAERRDPRPYQLRFCAIVISTGLTLLVYAALR